MDIGVVWLSGNSLRFPNGNASTNRMAEIAKGFKGNNYKTKLVSLVKPEAANKGSYNSIEYEYYQGYEKKNLSLIEEVFGGIFHARRKAQYLSDRCIKENVSMIFCGSSSISTLFMFWLIGRNCGVTFVYDIVEDPLSSWLSKEVKYFSIKEWIQHLLNLVKMPFFYFFAWHLPHFICAITDDLKERIKSVGVKSDRIFVFPITKFIQDISLEGYSNSDKIKSINSDTIIHSGSTYYPKDGIGEILEAVNIVIKEGIIINIEFYGPIKKLDRNRIEAFAKENHIGEQVKVRGFVELSELLDLQKKAFALVCYKPPIMQNKYNFATKIIDYLDAGRPIILSDLPVYKSFFEDKKNAIIPEGFSGDALAEKIKYLFNNPEKANQIGLEGRKTLQNRFNSSELTASLLLFIDQI